MFENYTFSKIMDDVLDTIPEAYDKREGSIIYDAIAPAVVEISVMYQMLDDVIRNSFGDSADREYLIRRAAERGIVPKEASKAVLKLETLPTEIEVPVGTRFSYNTFFYTVTEMVSVGVYKVECDEAGSIGNKYLGALVLNDHVEGLASARIVALLIPGEDEEETETFRKRYLNSFLTEAYGGNIADYKQKVNAINGVGGVKVLPHTDADGSEKAMHVKLLVINSEFETPSAELVAYIQKQIDPIEQTGAGVGIAPIGHFCHVEGVTAYRPDVECEITYADGYSWEVIQEEYNAMLDKYFHELNQTWQDLNSGIILRRSQIESRILDLKGVIDVTGVLIDGEEKNKQLDIDQILAR